MSLRETDEERTTADSLVRGLYHCGIAFGKLWLLMGVVHYISNTPEIAIDQLNLTFGFIPTIFVWGNWSREDWEIMYKEAQ